MIFSSYLYICTMLIGIFIIITMSLPIYSSAAALSGRIDAYFNYIGGEYHLDGKAGKEANGEHSAAKKVWDREPEPGTFTGLALFLGFNSRQEFEYYESHGLYAAALQRGRLHVEAGYEKKLHHQSPAGAIFALKSMGWNEKTEAKDDSHGVPNTLEVVVVESGPNPAETESQVIL